MANQSGDPTVAPVVLHPQYYIRSGDTTFIVENHLFRVHRFFFERESPYFRAMLSTPAAPGEQPRGTSDRDAFVLGDVKSADFALFLWVFYNPKYSLYDTATLDEWLRILKLAQHWGFTEVKHLVTRSLELLEIGHIQKIVLYHQYGIDRSLLISSYAAICARAEPISNDEGNALGIQTVLMLAAARERARCDPAAGPLSPAHITGSETQAIIQDVFGLTAPSTSDGSTPPGNTGKTRHNVNGKKKDGR